MLNAQELEMKKLMKKANFIAFAESEDTTKPLNSEEAKEWEHLKDEDELLEPDEILVPIPQDSH